ncbi:histidine kinase [Pyxidicoccus fallax]|uniref:Histidine kinase n=1 Tax=Pyxidicoccus fallax TaxID=394095 RepID=A0A848LIT4_9BACT|nr:histidine kinase [Pyxidicoccus fallax]NMO17632.1 histidine kinase [Pyxidicoccus fallax]NPC84587.1 histidine kinase [Pyxidicoccus fallax]
MKSSRAWVYAACQLGGWSLYALVNTVLMLLVPGRELGAIGGFWLFCLCAAALTHLVRARLRLRQQAGLPLGALVPRVLALAVGLGLVQTGVSFLLSVFVLRLYTPAQASLPGFIVSFVIWTLMMLMWLVIYFAIHSVERARQAELERWKLEAEAQSAELRFLKAQLQPHFLFNCLNSVRALISEDPARAQEVVTRLSALLRYALAARGPEMVPLERELRVVRDYLGLEGVRLESRLRVREDVEPAALGVPVPAMLVQTLVENAIKHGVSRVPEGGEVIVSAHVRDGALQLDVTNTAAPHAPGGSVPVRDGALPPELPHADSNGVGLRNASERLRLLCGANASLRLDQTQAALTTARVRIPLSATA